jgi:hypothetical protein
MGCDSPHHAGHLRLDHNRLSGPIPPEIGRLCMGGSMAFGAVELDHNLLSGAIPPEIGDIGYVAYLYLDNNQLTGSIPSQLGNLVSALGIRLQGNRLSGPIPVALSNLTRLWGGESDLRWNALYTGDPTLRAFLDSKQVGGDWEGTQTVAPPELAAGGATLDSVALSWSPILYTGDTGGYELWYGTQAGGPYNLGGTTADKAMSTSPVSGLSPGTTYYFTLDTVTEPHASNQNAVVSGRTAEVSATTAGHLRLHASGTPRPGTSAINYSPGQTRANNALVSLGTGGALIAYVAQPSGTVHVVLDVNGYFDCLSPPRRGNRSRSSRSPSNGCPRLGP